jgi:hypothetical protein
MWDTRPVEVVLQLPEHLAEDVEEVQEKDPEFLNKIIRYGLTRRAMFEQLNRNSSDSLPSLDRST